MNLYFLSLLQLLYHRLTTMCFCCCPFCNRKCAQCVSWCCNYWYYQNRVRSNFFKLIGLMILYTACGAMVFCYIEGKNEPLPSKEEFSHTHNASHFGKFVEQIFTSCTKHWSVITSIN